MKYHQFEGLLVSMSGPRVLVGFLDQNYVYKSVAIHICHDAKLVPITLLGIEPRNAAYEGYLYRSG